MHIVKHFIVYIYFNILPSLTCIELFINTFQSVFESMRNLEMVIKQTKGKLKVN